MNVSAPNRVPFLNVYVHDVTMREVIERFDGGMLLTLHVDSLMKLQKDREFYRVIEEFDLVTCDSQILFAVARLLGTPLRARVSGSDFFPRFYMHHRENPNVTIFICGGAPGVAEVALDRINAKVGRNIVVGALAPPFGFESDPEEVDRVISSVNTSKASVFVLGLGGGRQEKFIAKHRHKMPHVRWFMPLGGTIDYEAGTLPRPAPWVTDAGLEWLYRVIKQPKQRWYRYFVQQPPALLLLLLQRVGRYRDPFSDEP